MSREGRLPVGVLHYRSPHDRTVNACGTTTGSHILAPQLYTVEELRTGYQDVYSICQGCLHSKALKDDIIEKELSRD